MFEGAPSQNAKGEQRWASERFHTSAAQHHCNVHVCSYQQRSDKAPRGYLAPPSPADSFNNGLECKINPDSPADFIRRRDVVGCGVHLGDNDVWIIGELQKKRGRVIFPF